MTKQFCGCVYDYAVRVHAHIRVAPTCRTAAARALLPGATLNIRNMFAERARCWQTSTTAPFVLYAPACQYHYSAVISLHHTITPTTLKPVLLLCYYSGLVANTTTYIPPSRLAAFHAPLVRFWTTPGQPAPCGARLWIPPTTPPPTPHCPKQQPHWVPYRHTDHIPVLPSPPPVGQEPCQWPHTFHPILSSWTGEGSTIHFMLVRHAAPQAA